LSGGGIPVPPGVPLGVGAIGWPSIGQPGGA
jgi:hypothetical protein